MTYWETEAFDKQCAERSQPAILKTVQQKD